MLSAELNIYKLGVYLREIYNDFLGNTYTPEIMKARTTEHSLSILSAQLVNAGLWPPAGNQIWIENLKWQPIPTDYLELEEDTLMLGSLCPNFISQMNQILQTTETQRMLAQYQPLFDYLTKHTERNISTPSDVALLYATLETLAERNDMLPNWAKDVFPDGSMRNVTLLEYDLLSATHLQRQLNGGIFLGEIIGNSLKYIVGDISRNRKMMVYSGDARNIVGVLKNLDLWSPHIPNEASALIFELYFDNDTGIHGMKINYYMDIDDTMITLTLPNCTDICPLQTLINATINLIPQDSRSLCGWSTENLTKEKKKEEFNSSNYNGFISMDALATGNLTGSQRDELMQQLKQQIAVANAQELLTKMTEKCFKKCIGKPGTSLDSSEQKCIAMCMDRYMDSFNLVSKTYSERLQRERNR
ncbi:Uncharacterized protein DBV15_05864, partial [Temnothorax longispinosus]